jgi:hypothetical protein
LGLLNSEQTNDAGKVFKFKRSSLQFQTVFQGGFDRIWGFSPWPTPHYYVSIQNAFCISMLDTNFALRNFVSGCGIDCGDHTYYTTNYGTNWNNIPQLGNDFLGPQSRGYDIDPYNPYIAYSAYPRIGSGNWLLIYKTTNKGSTWNVIDSVNAQTNPITLGYTKINPFRTNYLYIRGFNNLLISTNSGLGFVPAQNSVSFEELKFNRFDSSIVGYNGVNLYKSTNHGVNWGILSSLPDPVKCLAISPSNINTLYAGTNFALYKSTNGGVSWAIYNDSFYPSKALIGITMDQGMGDTVFVVTKDAVYRVWAGYVSVKQISSNVPEHFMLLQNYPNPFNPATKIKFQVPKSGFVKLIVYDMLGKEIRTDVNDELQPGTYEVDFDGSNLPSGIYYYKLESGKFTETKKMVLIK